MSHPPPPTATPSSTAALDAFLHGIEVRAWVLAFAQAGDEAPASEAMQQALIQFLGIAPGQLLAAWPLQFWTCLMEQPGLHGDARDLTGLPGLAPGPRAALLLRIVAGLDFEHAARVLGLPQPRYEALLQQALADEAMDDERMQALRQTLHDQVHAMPPAQRQTLARWRRRALEQTAADGQTARAPTALGTGARSAGAARRLRGLWWLLALLLVALLASFLLPLLRPGAQGDGPLPAEAIAPPPALSDSVVLTHPDYAHLASGDAVVLARELAFLSWLAAAEGGLMPLDPEARPAATAPARFSALATADQALLASAETAWDSLEPATRDELLRNAHDWRGRPAAERENLRGRVRQWDGMAAMARARERAAFQAWQRLGEGERQRIRAAHERLAALPADEQARLREQFAASPADTQQLWWLGPWLGQELAPMASLFAFMPEADRPALLAALGTLDAPARADLATLASRLDEGQRQALRRALLEAGPEQRPALIRDRLGQ